MLDVMLPDLDGFEVARRLRESEGAGTRVPVIFLTARDTTADKVAGAAPRQRRLRDQAVQHRGADRAGEGRAAPVRRRRAGRPPPELTPTSSSTRTRATSGGPAA